MKRSCIVILSILTLMGCSDPSGLPCDGYEAEPSLTITTTQNNPFAIFYLNSASLGDTVFSNSLNTLQLPIDPSSDTMFYTLIADSSLGEFMLVFNIEHRYCETTDELNLYFESAHFVLSDNLPDLYAVRDSNRIKVETSFSNSDFLNNTLSNHKLEFDF